MGRREHLRSVFRKVYDPGVRLNDHTFVRSQGEWHVFHIWLDDATLDGVIGHATSPDLRRWERRPDILPKESPPSWESGPGGNAPHVFAWDGVYYLYYSRYREGVQQIGLAQSSDLFHWKKRPDNPIFHPAPFWCPWEDRDSSTQFRPRCCRDPHVMRIGHEFVVYYVAMTREPNVCAVACAASDDLVHWVDRGPVLTRPVVFGSGQAMMESPCVVQVGGRPDGGRRHLFYTHAEGLHHASSDDPFQFSNPRFFCSTHASEVFPDGEGGWMVSHCAKPLGRSHTHEKGTGLWLARLELVEGEPRLAELDIVSARD